MNSPQMTQKLAAEGSEAADRMTPEQFRAAFLRDYDEMEKQIKQLKVKLY
jgi:hypothetical protein